MAIRNPGTVAYDRIYAKRRPFPVDGWTDRELLTLLLGSREAADSVLTITGDLANFHELGEGRRVLDYPGCGPGTAAKCDALYEVACRIASGVGEEAPAEDEEGEPEQHGEN